MLTYNVSEGSQTLCYPILKFFFLILLVNCITLLLNFRSPLIDNRIEFSLLSYCLYFLIPEITVDARYENNDAQCHKPPCSPKGWHYGDSNRSALLIP